jgi:hypothetical protein
MDERLKKWYTNYYKGEYTDQEPRRRYVAGLVNKTSMLSYAKQHQIPTPERYFEVKDIDAIDFRLLPERLVIKPNNSADSDCVMLFGDGRELLSGEIVPLNARASFAEKTLASGRFLNAHTKILGEEFIQDYDSSFLIPRDFKVYVAGGHAHLIQVIDRNGAKETRSSSFYDRNWQRMEDNIQETYRRGPLIEKPARFEELLNLSERIARDIACFMRLDFYISAERVVFGEFTSFPFAGRHYTQEGDRLMCEMMDKFPDPF